MRKCWVVLHGLCEWFYLKSVKRSWLNVITPFVISYLHKTPVRSGGDLQSWALGWDCEWQLSLWMRWREHDEEEHKRFHVTDEDESPPVFYGCLLFSQFTSATQRHSVVTGVVFYLQVIVVMCARKSWFEKGWSFKEEPSSFRYWLLQIDVYLQVNCSHYSKHCTRYFIFLSSILIS